MKYKTYPPLIDDIRSTTGRGERRLKSRLRVRWKLDCKSASENVDDNHGNVFAVWKDPIIKGLVFMSPWLLRIKLLVDNIRSKNTVLVRFITQTTCMIFVDYMLGKRTENCCVV